MAETLSNIARALLEQGAGLGWGDEAEAWLRSKVGDKSYEQNLADIAKSYGSFSAEHPVLAPSLEFAGGAAPMALSYAVPGLQASAPATTAKTVGTLAKIAQSPYLRGAVTGAGTGAIAGAGAAKPNERIGEAVAGGLTGGVLGAAVPVASRLGSASKQLWRERVNPTDEFIQNRALEKLSDALTRSNLSPQDLQAKLAADRLLGVPSMPGNISQPLARLTETIANRSGAGADTVEKAIEEQMLGNRQRVYGQVSKSLKPKDYYAYDEQLTKDLRDQAKNLYENAYAVGDVNDPRINEILGHPKFKMFYDKARDIADTEALAAKLRGEDPSKYKLKEIFRVDPQGNIVKTEVPDVRTLDYIKRGIDASIDAGFKGQGGLSSADAIGLKGVRNEFVNALDQNVPEYKAARKQYAGEMEVLDALHAGRENFGSLDPEQVQKLVKDMSDAEKDAFKTGVARNLYSQVMNPSNNKNTAKSIVGSPIMREKLEPLFDNHGQYRLFTHALERESELYNQAQQILRGSPTARRLQAREAFEEGDSKAAMLAEFIDKNFKPSLTNTVKTAISNTAMSDKTANKLADMLMDKDPHTVAATVKMLDSYANKLPPAVDNLGKGEKLAISGATAAFPPSPVDVEKRDVEKDLAGVSTYQPRRNIEEDLKTLNSQ